MININDINHANQSIDSVSPRRYPGNWYFLLKCYFKHFILFNMKITSFIRSTKHIVVLLFPFFIFLLFLVEGWRKECTSCVETIASIVKMEITVGSSKGGAISVFALNQVLITLRDHLFHNIKLSEKDMSAWIIDIFIFFLLPSIVAETGNCFSVFRSNQGQSVRNIVTFFMEHCWTKPMFRGSIQKLEFIWILKAVHQKLYFLHVFRVFWI